MTIFDYLVPPGVPLLVWPLRASVPAGTTRDKERPINPGECKKTEHAAQLPLIKPGHSAGASVHPD